MSQRPLFLDNLYSIKRQRRIECFLKGCKIVFITGATAMIVLSLAVLSARDIANRTKRQVSTKEGVVKTGSDQVKTVSYSTQKQK